MDYFELFGIPVQLKVDTPALKKRFIELSKQFHPDYFATDNEAAQSEALEKSAQLNKAWKTFQDTGATIKYVLQSKGLLEEEEKYSLPPGFLMEVLEINEELMEPDPSKTAGQSKLRIETHLDELQKQIYAPVKKIVESYDENTVTTEELLQVKEYYFKKKYLDRIGRQLAEMK